MSEEVRDPWQDVTTRSGYPADVIISALQKEIRRGHVENAEAVSYEMLCTSSFMEECLWSRLQVISVEDVGLADPFAAVLIHSLNSMRKTMNPGHDRNLFAMHAVRYLALAEKDRSSDELACWIRDSFENGSLKIKFADYMYDKHTRKGIEMGRGDDHFYREAAKVSPQWDERDTRYRERILEELDKEKEK